MKIKHKRLLIEKYHDNDINGMSIDSAIEYLIETKSDLEYKGYTDIRINIYVDDYGACSSDLLIKFECKRLETDDEYNKRVAKITAQEVKQMIKEKEQSEKEYRKYLELRAKFEKP